MGDFEVNCHLCGDQVVRKQTEDGSWPMFNQDDSPHEHLSVSVSKILEHIHYKDDEDKTKTIGELTIQQFEERVSRLASKEAAMKLGTFLHATNGFVRKEFPQGFIKKTIVVDDKEYFITGSLDDQDDDTIIEAKFIQTRKQLKKVRQYAIDQCDIYGWMTEMPKNKLFLHIIDEHKNEDESHLNNISRGEMLVRDFIENNYSA